jgi:hypothetical protein
MIFLREPSFHNTFWRNVQLVLFRESQYTPKGVKRGIILSIDISTNNAPLRGEKNVPMCQLAN